MQASLFDTMPKTIKDSEEWFCPTCETEIIETDDSEILKCESCNKEVHLEDAKEDISLDTLFGVN